MCLALPSRCEFRKLFKKKLGRNVYALNMCSQKLKELKVTQLRDLPDIALLFSTNKSYLPRTFVIVGLEFWRVKCKKLLLLININLVG